MPQYSVQGLSELIREEKEKQAQEDIGGRLVSLVGEVSGMREKEKISKQERASRAREDFFRLMDRGVDPNLALEDVKSTYGTDLSFVDEGFKQMTKQQRELKKQESQAGLSDINYEKELSQYRPDQASKEDIALIKQKYPSKIKEIENYFDVSSYKRPEKVEGLTPQQITEGNKLAREIFGASSIRTKDGFNNIVKPIYDRMKQGETIDKISDDLRFKGQSPEFTGAIRDAAQSITINLSDQRAQNVLDRIDDTIASGNIGKTRDILKRATLMQAGADDRRTAQGTERTIKFLSEIEQDLKDYEAKGGNTNIFTGTLEEIARKVGTVKDEELRKIATKISKARQQYRRAMTGVAFSPGENLEYDRMFPNINKTSNFNSSTISGLIESMQGDIDNFYSLSMGEDAYNKLFKEDATELNNNQETQYSPEQIESFATEEEMDAANLPKGTPVIVGGIRGRVG